MSIKVVIQASGLNLQATVQDDALAHLIKITQDYRDLDGISPMSSIAPETDAPQRPTPLGNEEMTKAKLAVYGAAEILNRVRWENYPEKILLLASWHESREGEVPWKSADMDVAFKQAKERPPANFPRDIKNAIKSGWIHTRTPRTYSVTRTGWNKIAEALSDLG